MTIEPFAPQPVITAADIAAIEDLLAGQLDTVRDVILVQGEAILPLEAAARSVAGPGTRALNIVTGPYGALFGSWLAEGGAQVRTLVVEFDAVVGVDAVAEALADGPVDVVSVVHAEAATGGLNPLPEIASLVAASGALLVVDAVASVGADPVRPDDWGADVVVFGPQKGLAGPAGVSAVVVSDRAWSAIAANPAAPRSSYLSLLDLKQRWIDTGRTALPGYVAAWETAALQRALADVRAEGIDAIVERHRASAATARDGLRELGLPPWIARDADAAAVVTTFAPPAGRGAADFAAAARAAGARITTIAPGLLGDQVLRLNHTGAAAQVDAVRHDLEAIAAAR